MIIKNKNNTLKTKKPVFRQLEAVIGCKWSVSVLKAVANNITRPGKLERHVEGISKKVLSERLRKLSDYGLLEKHTYAEVPPRTEYSLTENGKKLILIIEQIKALDMEIKNTEQEYSTDS